MFLFKTFLSFNKDRFGMCKKSHLNPESTPFIPLSPMPSLYRRELPNNRNLSQSTSPPLYNRESRYQSERSSFYYENSQYHHDFLPQENDDDISVSIFMIKDKRYTVITDPVGSVNRPIGYEIGKISKGEKLWNHFEGPDFSKVFQRK